jgi:cilia- and flagella-associated protein 44
MALSGADRQQKPLHTYPPGLQPSSTTIAHYGLNCTRFNAIDYLGSHTVLTSGGKFVLFLHLDTGVVESQDGPADGAVGAVAVHPSHLFYAVGERRPADPLIQVYDWPSKKAVKSFSGGAEVGYSTLAFNAGGTRFASVASEPDFTLAIWDWSTAALLLRAKCFGTDVYTVAFSRFDDSRLVTGGAGHLKFWTMANTFTGKKLQGSLGKFGRHEISDVDAFVVLSDGKVLSGSDSGNLLLWEGDLILCTFARSFAVDENGANGVGQAPYDIVACHDGAIHIVSLQGPYVVTAGDDGFMRYWNLRELEVAAGAGLPPYYAPTCVYEVCAGPAFRIRSVALDDEHGRWILMDAFGTIATLPNPLAGGKELTGDTATAAGEDTAATVAFQLNGAPLTCAAVSPVLPLAVTGGVDGVVRCYDAVRCTERCRLAGPPCDSHHDPVAVVAVEVLAPFSNTKCTCVVAGYADGVVRLLEVVDHCSAIHMIGQWKAHAAGLLALAVSEDAVQLASVSTDGDVFFFAVETTTAGTPITLRPMGLCTSPLAKPTCAAWDSHASGGHGGCFLGYHSGELLSVHAPAPESIDHANGFVFPCVYDLVAIRQRQLPPPKTEAEELDMTTNSAAVLQEEDVGPWPIVFVVRLPGEEGIAVGMEKSELAYLYKASVRYPNQLNLPPLPATGVEPPNYVEEPLINLCYRDCVPEAAFVSPHGELVVSVSGNRLLLREAGHREHLSLLGASHDSTGGAVTGAFVSHDGGIVITAGSDGMLVTQLRSGHNMPSPLLAVDPIPAQMATLAAVPAVTNVADATPSAAATKSALKVPTLSVQEQKEADDAARAAAEKSQRLHAFLQKLEAVRKDYNRVVDRNKQLALDQRLSHDELELDASLREALEVEKQRRVKEAGKEFVLTTAREDAKTEKLRKRFVSNLLCDRFELFALEADFSVASFRLLDPRESVARLTAAMQQLQTSDDENSASESGNDSNDTNNKTGPRGAVTGVGGAAIPQDEKWGVMGMAKTAAPAQQTTAAQTTTVDSRASAPGTALATGASVKQQLDKMDSRRLERQERRLGYQQLMARTPNPATEDAALVRQLELDLKHRGECTFRTDAGYRSEYAFRPTATAKLQRMTALIHDIAHMKSTFNDDLLQLRAEKREALKTYNQLRASYAKVRFQLGLDSSADAPMLALTVEEEPESLYVMSRVQLETYIKQKTEERARAEEEKKAQRGFGADLAGAQARERPRGSSTADAAAAAEAASYNAASGSRNSGAGKTSVASVGTAEKRPTKSGHHPSSTERPSRQSTIAGFAMRERMDAELKGKLENIKLSPEEKEEQEMEKAVLERDLGQLEVAMAAIRHRFNDKLEALRLRRASVDADLSLACGRLTLLFREYQLLLVFRSQDKRLKEALHTVKREREEAQRAITAQHQSLSSTEERIKQLTAQLKASNQTAEAYLEEHCPSDKLAYIKRVYYRQVKRRRHGEAAEDDDDVTSDDEDDEEDDGIGEEVRPPNCSTEAWEKMLAYRETRLDIADAVEAAKADVAATHKKLERSQQTVQQLAERLKTCRGEMQVLEAQKRQELNMLNTVVPLRISQVRCLDSQMRVPPRLYEEPVVIISDAQVAALRQRIYDLAEQKQQRREEVTSMAAELQRLKDARQAAHRVYQDWQAKVTEVMLLKFGQHVDLEMLESCGSSWAIEAKKEELRHLELKWARAVRKMENQISELRTRLQGKVFENTSLLQNLGDLELERQQVDAALSRATSKTVQHYRGNTVASKQERAVLRELIAAQQEEVDALNAEIVMLKRKGGQVYSPAMM